MPKRVVQNATRTLRTAHSSAGVTPAAGLMRINHIVVLMLENRSFDHMLGFLYAGQANQSPLGQPYEGLTGGESRFRPMILIFTIIQNPTPAKGSSIPMRSSLARPRRPRGRKPPMAVLSPISGPP
jgi:hypothetical protein